MTVADDVFVGRRWATGLRLGLLAGLLLTGCAPNWDARVPTATPSLSAAEVSASQAAATRRAATPTPSDTFTPAATLTPAATATPTLTPTVTGTPTPTPYPTLNLASFPRPPAALGGDAHFLFARPIGEGGNVFPASNYRYGATFNHQLETHHGEEFANPMGTPLVAVAAGTVYYAGSDAGQLYGLHLGFYGNLVILQLDQTWQGRPVFALYGHMNEIGVTTGQKVNEGDLLGTVGATGIAFGPHLHLEVRLDHPESYDATRNPELWLEPAGGSGALAIRITNAQGQYLPGMRVNLACADGAPRSVETYWDPGVNPDDVYGENAALTDIPAGYCKVETTYQGQPLTGSVTVQAGVLNFVWLQP